MKKVSGKEYEKIVLIVAVAVIVIVVVGALSSFLMMGGYGWGGVMGPGMGSGMMGYSGSGYGWLVLWLAIFVILIVVGVYFIITSFKREDKSPQIPSPLELIKHRYAKGEISTEEFKKMKKDLEK